MWLRDLRWMLVSILIGLHEKGMGVTDEPNTLQFALSLEHRIVKSDCNCRMFQEIRNPRKTRWKNALVWRSAILFCFLQCVKIKSY